MSSASHNQKYVFVDTFDTIATGLNYADTILNINQDTKLYLEPDLSNRFDPKAIAIRVQGTKQKMGYVSKQDLTTLHSLIMDPNVHTQVVITAPPPAGKPYCTITLTFHMVEYSTKESSENLLLNMLQVIAKAKKESDARKPWNKPKLVSTTTATTTTMDTDDDEED